MKVVLSLLLCITATLADIAGECDLAGFYLELGCSAIHTNPSGKCPDSFSCPDLHPDPKMCYYKGVAYGDNSPIPQELVSSPCSKACECRIRSETRIECAAMDCFETADKDLKECVRTFKLDQCCAAGSVCGKDAIAKLSTCEFEGKTYREGELFEPKNTRKSCVCNPKFNGSIDDPESCRDIDCGLELHYQQKIMKYCAPVYYGTANKIGCPIEWVCPSNETTIISGTNISGVKEKCVFGNATLNVGDEVEVARNKCTKCTCQVPPFVACSRKMTSQEECASG